MASYGACRADGAEVVAPRHRRARWSYWLMLQVNGTVAARPWSALVADARVELGCHDVGRRGSQVQ